MHRQLTAAPPTPYPRGPADISEPFEALANSKLHGRYRSKLYYWSTQKKLKKEIRKKKP
jgi:hypothetical protein